MISIVYLEAHANNKHFNVITKNGHVVTISPNINKHIFYS